MKERIKNLINEKNPLVLARRKKMRRGLVNTSPTLLCPNCIGGILFHDLGLQFRSPTVNTMMFQQDLAKMVLNLDFYLRAELEFYEDPEHPYPCARLGDITIHFTHYKTEDEARTKWEERCRRIDRENLFIFLEERDALSEEMIRSLSAVRAKGIVVFTVRKYVDIPYALQIPCYADDGEVGNILKKNHFTGSRDYEKYFDFVKWFNEADGGDYDVSAYAR